MLKLKNMGPPRAVGPRKKFGVTPLWKLKHTNLPHFASLHTDVRRGASGTSRDVPIFVQFHAKIRTVDDTQRKKKVEKNKADFE